MTLLAETNERELEVWTRLYALAGPGRPITANETAQLQSAIAEARLLNRLMSLSSLRSEQLAIAYGLRYDSEAAREYSDPPAKNLDICKPIPSETPAEYGAAPLEKIIERARAAPITRTSGRGG